MTKSYASTLTRAAINITSTTGSTIAAADVMGVEQITLVTRSLETTPTIRSVAANTVVRSTKSTRATSIIGGKTALTPPASLDQGHAPQEPEAQSILIKGSLRNKLVKSINK